MWAAVTGIESHDVSDILSMAKERCCALEILEGRLAKEDISDSEIRKGDLIIRMRAPSCHCFNVGDELELGQP